MAPERLDLGIYKVIFLSHACRFNQMAQVATSFLKVHRRNFILYFFRSEACYEQGRYTLEISDLKRCLPIINSLIRKPLHNEKVIYYSLRALLKMGKIKTVSYICNRMLKSPVYEQHKYLRYYFLSTLYSSSTQFEKKEEFLKKTIDMTRPILKRGHLVREIHLNTLSNLGGIYFNKRRIPLAKKCLKTVLRSRPFGRNPYMTLSYVYWHERKHKKAILFLKKYLNENPGNIYAAENLSKFYLRMGAYKEYLEFAKGAAQKYHRHRIGYFIEIQGGLIAAEVNKAILTGEEKLQIFRKTILLCTEGIIKYPKYAYFYYDRGRCYYHLRRWDEARSNLRKAYNLSKKDPLLQQRVVRYLKVMKK